LHFGKNNPFYRRDLYAAFSGNELEDWIDEGHMEQALSYISSMRSTGLSDEQIASLMEGQAKGYCVTTYAIAF